MPVSKDRCTEVVEYAIANGDEIACAHFGLPQETITRYKRQYKQFIRDDKDAEVPEERLVDLAAKAQKANDINAVIRKENRESYRLYNVLDATYQEYINLLSECPLAKFDIITIPAKESSKIGILHASDLHLNEIIDPRESNGNCYDFTVASKRLQKYVAESKTIFNAMGVTQVYLFLTGDIINSDRRLSEKLVSATSQVRASLLATYLIQQVIIDLANDYTVSVASVAGNESRISQDDMDSCDILSSNNWDYAIYNNLRMLFSGKSIEFIDSINNMQQVVTLDNGFNALLIHGNYLKGAISDKQIGVLLQQYAYKGIPIHGVFCGHIHSASVGDIVSRASSLCGGNSYSTNDLQFVSRASQNIYIVNKDKGYHGIKIDLQNADEYKGYNIIEELERYNVRNAVPNTRIIMETVN